MKLGVRCSRIRKFRYVAEKYTDGVIHVKCSSGPAGARLALRRRGAGGQRSGFPLPPIARPLLMALGVPLPTARAVRGLAVVPPSRAGPDAEPVHRALFVLGSALPAGNRGGRVWVEATIEGSADGSEEINAVGAIVAEQHVTARIPEQDGGALPAEQHVVARIPEQVVVALPAQERVVGAAAAKILVVAAPAREPVVVRVGGQPVVELRAEQVLDAREGVAHPVVGPAVAVRPAGPGFPARWRRHAWPRCCSRPCRRRARRSGRSVPGPPTNVSSPAPPSSRSSPRPAQSRSSPGPPCSSSSPADPPLRTPATASRPHWGSQPKCSSSRTPSPWGLPALEPCKARNLAYQPMVAWPWNPVLASSCAGLSRHYPPRQSLHPRTPSARGSAVSTAAQMTHA